MFFYTEGQDSTNLFLIGSYILSLQSVTSGGKDYIFTDCKEPKTGMDRAFRGGGTLGDEWNERENERKEFGREFIKDYVNVTTE